MKLRFTLTIAVVSILAIGLPVAAYAGGDVCASDVCVGSGGGSEDAVSGGGPDDTVLSDDEVVGGGGDPVAEDDAVVAEETDEQNVLDDPTQNQYGTDVDTDPPGGCVNACEGGGPTPPELIDDPVVDGGGTGPTPVAGVSSTPIASGGGTAGLPFTGLPLFWFGAAGIGMMLAGAGIQFMSRPGTPGK